MVRWVKAFFKGLIAFFKAYDTLKEPCAFGHPQHGSWHNCPVCAFISDADTPKNVESDRPFVALRIQDQKGELRTLTFSTGRYRIGHDALANVTVTPFQQKRPSNDRYELAVTPEEILLTALGAEGFVVGGRPYRTSTLYDRDRIDLLGARMQMIVLEGGCHVQ